MRSLIVIVLAFLLAGNVNAQVNVGGTTPPKSGAALEVTSGGNKGFLGPKVALTGISVWAPLADTAIEGMIVFNLGTNAGMPNKGYYYWLDGKWTILGSITSGDGGGTGGGGTGGIDLIRAKLTTSLNAYDGAAIDSWIPITPTEYAAITTISGALSCGTPFTDITGTTPLYAPGPNATATSNQNPMPNAYCVAVSFYIPAGARNQPFTGLRIKFGRYNNSINKMDNFIDYGSVINGTFTSEHRQCWVIKKPTLKTQANSTSPSATGGYLGAYVNASGFGNFFTVTAVTGVTTYYKFNDQDVIDGGSITDTRLNGNAIGFADAKW